MSKLTYTLMLLLLCSTAFAQKDFKPIADESVFYNRLSTETKNTTSTTSDFTQKKRISMLAKDVISKGKFYFQQPDKICMSYTSPVSYLVVINGAKMKVVSEGKTNVIDVESNKMMKKMKGLIYASMTGDLRSIAGEYSMSIFESSKQYYIKIKPSDKATATYISEIAIYMEKSDLTVSQMSMFEPSGDYTDYLFSNKKKNETIDSKIFSLR